MRLKCFIAMPIGRTDTDRLYKRALKATLQDLGYVRPIRVDERDSNAPIDEQIYELMEGCHFCIADLTYSRPSVYYEVGWVRGQGKQVIFTCRADHLSRRRKADDQFGNLIVHFDLEQEAIIPWTDRGFATFASKLRRRVNAVTKNLRRDLKGEALRRQERAAFARLSTTNKLTQLRTAAAKCLRGLRLETCLNNNPLALRSRAEKSSTGVVVHFKRTITKDDLAWCGRIPNYMHHMCRRPWHIGHFETAHIILVSLRAVPDDRVTSFFSDHSRAQTLRVFENTSPGDKPRFHKVHILDNVRSLSEFTQLLNEHLRLHL